MFHWACKNKRVDVARNVVEHHGTEWKEDVGICQLVVIVSLSSV